MTVMLTWPVMSTGVPQVYVSPVLPVTGTLVTVIWPLLPSNPSGKAKYSDRVSVSTVLSVASTLEVPMLLAMEENTAFRSSALEAAR